MDQQDLDAAAQLMDDEIREAMHAEPTEWTPESFLTEYQRRHEAKYGQRFTWA